jgi:molybdopterin-guanine dinucleotide biosynthesis protein A
MAIKFASSRKTSHVHLAATGMRMIKRSDIPKLRKIFPRPDFEIVEIRELGESEFVAIRTAMEIESMRAAGVKFKIVED